MKRRLRGVTLIELMITLVVAIVILAIGIPAFQSIQANSRAAAQANALVTALNLARSEAVGRGVPVAVCAAASPTTCAATAAWQGGWLVFTDAALDGTPAADELVRAFAAPGGQASIVPAPSVTLVRFNSRGEQVGGAAVTFRVEQSATIANQDRCVRVAGSGQIRTERVADNVACP